MPPTTPPATIPALEVEELLLSLSLSLLLLLEEEEEEPLVESGSVVAVEDPEPESELELDPDDDVSVGDGLESDVGFTAAELVPAMLLVAVAVVEDDTELVLGFALWSWFMTQLPSALHEYPKGQHLSPHFSNVPVNAVVMTAALGYASLSSSDTSQGMLSISAQSLPEGQHIALVLPAKAMHLSPLGQQKLDGRPAFEH